MLAPSSPEISEVRSSAIKDQFDATTVEFVQPISNQDGQLRLSFHGPFLQSSSCHQNVRQCLRPYRQIHVQQSEKAKRNVPQNVAEAGKGILALCLQSKTRQQ